MSKHTPGPWRVSARANRMIDVLHSNNQKGAITHALCRVQARDSWVDEAAANARLIAAAPELLEALKNMCEGFRILKDSDFPALAKARAAIAKATGYAP